MERKHYNWRPNLLRAAEAEPDDLRKLLELIGTVPKNEKLLAQKILEEGKTPGEYFDGPTHYFDVIQIMCKLTKDPGVKAIGIFGSRVRREHEPLRSDTDIYVINDTPIEYDWSESRGPTASRKTYRHVGVGNGINIQECTSENWKQVLNDPTSVDKKTHEVMSSVHWLWIRKGLEVERIL